MRAKILYVEDDENLGFVTKDNLEFNNFCIVHCTDGVAAWNTFQHDAFDLCILDVMLPQLDGFSLAQLIRSRNAQVPILFLSARVQKEDRIHGLKLGADDYLTKPFSIEELVLKIDVFLRRSRSKSAEVFVQNPEKQVKLGLYLFNFERLQLIFNDVAQEITHREAEVLWYLASRLGQIVRRDDLLKAVWGDDDYFMGRSLDVFVSRLRKHLCQDASVRIENIHGIGFRLVV